MNRVETHIHFLRYLSVTTSYQRRNLLQTATTEQLNVLYEKAFNILQGNISLTSQDYSRLYKHRNVLRKLSLKEIDKYTKIQLLGKYSCAVRDLLAVFFRYYSHKGTENSSTEVSDSDTEEEGNWGQYKRNIDGEEQHSGKSSDSGDQTLAQTGKMTDQNGYKTSILIPLSRYEQLLRHQQQHPSTSSMKSPPKAKRQRLTDDGSHQNNDSDKEMNKNESTSQAVEVSHEEQKSVKTSGVDSADNKEAQLARKLMYTVKRRFSKPMTDKIIRLLLFILNFGSHVITMNEQGNVFIRNHLLDPKSNIVDLLQASVSEKELKPVGLTKFRESLRQINVPKIFLADSHLKAYVVNKNSDKQRNQTPNREDAQITKWETF